MIKALLILILGLIALGYGWVMPAYQIDKDLGTSRLLNGFDPRFATFQRFFIAIEPGMTRAEIEELMTQHYPADGKRLPPKRVTDSEVQLFLFMNPEHSKNPNCEGMSIHFKDGRVSGKGYSMD